MHKNKTELSFNRVLQLVINNCNKNQNKAQKKENLWFLI